MTYKEKTEEFIKDLNIMLTDTLMFPDRVKFKDAKFELTLIDGMVDGEDAISTRFCYIEGTHQHLIFTRIFYNSQKDHLWHVTYFSILRQAMFACDSIRNPNDNSDNSVNVLSFLTIFRSGLDKLKTNKQ